MSSTVPERDLTRLIAGMRPLVVPGEFVYAVVSDPSSVTGCEIWATVREPEGVSVVLSRQDADARGLAYDVVLGWITLQVHSALDAVGLTAAVSTALADAGIACNVLAGGHHDHLLVPIADVAPALTALMTLTGRGSFASAR